MASKRRKSKVHQLRALMAWFRMTSRGDTEFVKGTRAKHANLFSFDMGNSPARRSRARCPPDKSGREDAAPRPVQRQGRSAYVHLHPLPLPNLLSLGQQRVRG